MYFTSSVCWDFKYIILISLFFPWLIHLLEFTFVDIVSYLHSLSYSWRDEIICKNSVFPFHLPGYHKYVCLMLYCTVLCCLLLSCTVPYYTVLYCTVLSSTVLRCTVPYRTVLYCTALSSTVLYRTVLCCTIFYSTVLYCTVLYCAVQHFSLLKLYNSTWNLPFW